MSLPRILVIDDQFGGSIENRRNLCLSFGLMDITGDDTTPEVITDPLAEAMFTSAQKKEKGVTTNDVQVALSTVGDGWPHKDGWRWSMVLLDIRFASGRVQGNGALEGRAGDDDFGIRILEAIHESFPDIPVVMLSSREREKVLEECLRKGAMDFIQRTGYSSDTTPPKEILRRKLFDHALLPDTRINGSMIVGNSLLILKVLRSARKMATGIGNILLLGETGTGKELLARYIHDMSLNHAGPYVIFDASHIPETLHESELFGHGKGAFTDAKEARAGCFEMAHNGTLFMDEIGDISFDLQAKLRRPLEERVVKRQGRNNEIQITTQVVLATNRDLQDDVNEGIYRNDLLNRINVSPITMPTLNERRDDIPLISTAILEGLCRKYSARWPRTITPDAMESLVSHDWSGSNVRGLRSVLEEAVLNNKDVEILLPLHVRFDQHSEPEKAEAAGVAGAAPPRPEGDIEFPIRHFRTEMVKSLISMLQKEKKRDSDEPNYPDTWYALTGESGLEPSEYQRKICDIIFSVADDELVKLIKENKSKLFVQALLQVVRHRNPAKKRLDAIIKNPEINSDNEVLSFIDEAKSAVAKRAEPYRNRKKRKQAK